jgi:hypothetical protein
MQNEEIHMLTSSHSCEHRESGPVIPVRAVRGAFRRLEFLPQRMVRQAAALLLWMIALDLCSSNRAGAAAPAALPQTITVEVRDLITGSPTHR